MQNTPQITVEVTLSPSSRLKIGFLGLVLLLAVVCLAPDVSLTIRIVALLYLAAASARIYYCFIELKGHNAVTELRFDDSCWWLRCAHADVWHAVSLCEQASVVTAGLITLKFAAQSTDAQRPTKFVRKSFHVLVFEDSAPAEQRRQLRLRLLAKPAEQQSPGIRA